MEENETGKTDPERMKLTELQDLLITLTKSLDSKETLSPTTMDNKNKIKSKLKRLVDEYPEYLESGDDYYDDNWADAAAKDPKLFKKMWFNIKDKLKEVIENFHTFQRFKSLIT